MTWIVRLVRRAFHYTRYQGSSSRRKECSAALCFSDSPFRAEAAAPPGSGPGIGESSSSTGEGAGSRAGTTVSLGMLLAAPDQALGGLGFPPSTTRKPW